ncbi:uncharacterized protein LOC121422412 isoform X4 [Lytechinus variegatus]|uniref:uncharacterized protein LOC121422412 isoform X4 n=1 Tax=Lytechinus variegatus TaxID=7654 RepID=UPI001BB1AF48|nr:uncharacterized protein LOC121422412 isoform X4 [Lytechinus variegatus]
MAPAPPPPSPPPPLPDEIGFDAILDGLSNGASDGNKSAGLPSFAAESNGMDANGQLALVETPQQKPWEKPLTIPEIRKSSQNWSLASDAGLLLYLQDFSKKMMGKTSDLEKRMESLVHDAKSADSRVHNTFNDFLMLANTQFIENRVYDDSEDVDGGSQSDKDKKEQSTKSREQREAEVIPRVIKALTLGINVLDTGFEHLDANAGNSDSEDEDPTYKAVDPILEAKDMYGHRSLPYIIGTPAFMQDDDVGLMDLSEEEEEDDESSVETISDSEKSELSDSEYTDTETESEFTGGRQKMTADTTATSTNRSDSEESDTGLFDDDEPSDQEAAAQPMNFQDELSAKLGGGMQRGAPNQEPGETTDESNRNRSISEDSKASSQESSKKGTRRKKLPLDREKKSKKKRSTSKTEDDNLFSEQAGQDGEADDSPFGRKGLFSSSGGGLFDDDKEDDGGLFDEKPSAVRRDVTSDHVYEDIVANPEEVKPSRKAPPGGVPLFGAGVANEDELFGSSSKSSQDAQRSLVRNRGNCKRDTQKTLLLRACSAAMTRRGSAESSKQDDSSSGGLFDSQGDDKLFSESSKPAPKKETGKPKAKKQVDLFGGENDSDLFGENKPQQQPKKKIPAGAVNVFGNAGPVGGQTEPPPLDDGGDEGMYVNTMVGAAGAGRSKQAGLGGGGGLFDNVDEDLFGAPPPRPVEKPTIKVDGDKLFADDDDDNDLFAAPPPLPKDGTKTKPKKAAAKKNQGLFDDIEGEGEEDFFGGEAKPKEQPKKKPPGGVALFEGADIFGSPPKTEAEPPQKKPEQLSPQAKANRSQNTLSLFHDEEDKDENLFATPPALPPKKDQLDPNPSKEEQMSRRRTKSKSIFDDEAILFGLKNEENPGVDLFGSDTPVPQTKAGFLPNCIEVIMPVKSSFPDLSPIPTKASPGKQPPQTKAKPSPPIAIQKNNELRSQPRRYRPNSPIGDEGGVSSNIMNRIPQKALKPPQQNYRNHNTDKFHQEPPPTLPKFPSPPKEPPPTFPRFPSPPQDPPPPTYPKYHTNSHEPPPTFPKFPSPPSDPPPPPKVFNTIPPPTLPKFPSPPNVPPPDFEPKTHKAKGPPTLPRSTHQNNDLPPPPPPSVGRLPSPAEFPRPPSFLDNPNQEGFPPPPPDVLSKKSKAEEHPASDNSQRYPSPPAKVQNGYPSNMNNNIPSSSSPKLLRRLRSHSTEDGSSVPNGVFQSRFAPIRKTNSNGAEWTVNHASENKTTAKNGISNKLMREDKPMKRVPARPPPLKFLTSKVSSSPPNSKSRPIISEPLSPKGLHSGALKANGQSAFVVHGDRRHVSPGASPVGSPLSDKSLDFEKDDMPIFSAQVLKNGYRKQTSPRAIGKSHDVLHANRQSPRRDSPAGSPSHHHRDGHYRWDADLPPPPPPPSYRTNGQRVNGNHRTGNGIDSEVNFARDIEAEVDGYDDNLVIDKIRDHHLRHAPKVTHENNIHVNGNHESGTKQAPPHAPPISPMLARKSKAGKKQPPAPAQKPAKAPIPPPVLAKPPKGSHCPGRSTPSREQNGHIASRFSSSPPTYPKSSNTTNSNNVMINAHMSIISNSSTCSQFSMNSLNLSNISANSHDSFTTVSSTNTYNPHNISMISSNSSNSNSSVTSQKIASFENSTENGHSKTTKEDSNQNDHCPPNELCKMSLIQKIALFSHKKDRPSPPSSPKSSRKGSPGPQHKFPKNTDAKSNISLSNLEAENNQKQPVSPKWGRKAASPIPSMKTPPADQHYHDTPLIQRPSSPRGTSDVEWKRPPVAAVSEQFEACIRRTPSYSFSCKRTVSRTPSSSSTEKSDSETSFSGGFTFPRPSKIKKQKGRVPLPHENTNSNSNSSNSPPHPVGTRGLVSKRSIKEPPKPLPKPSKNPQKVPARLPDAPPPTSSSSCPSSSASSSISYTPSGMASSSVGSVWRKAELFKASMNIDPKTLRPGAAPPERVVDSPAVGFDQPAVAKTLDVNPTKTRARISAKRRPPSRRSLQAAAASASNPALLSDNSKGADEVYQNIASDQPDLGASASAPAALAAASTAAPPPAKKPTSRMREDHMDGPPPLPPAAGVKPKKPTPSDDIFGDDPFSGMTNGSSSASSNRTVSNSKEERPFSIEGDSELFAAAAKKQPSRTHDNGDDLFNKPLKVDLDASIDDIFATPPVLGHSSKQSSLEADPTYEDIFASKANTNNKRSTLTDLAVDEDLFGDLGNKKSKDTSAVSIDEDLFSGPLSSSAAPATATTTKPKKKKSAKKTHVIEDDDDLFAEKPKKTKSKPVKATDDDLFGNSDIFSDLPASKPKEKKKKTTAHAQDAIFKDIGGDDIFAEPSPSSKPKKTKAKKKTTKEASDSIFDTDAPNIFDDPLNAMNN